MLSQYALDGGPDMGPAVYLEVRGPDRPGFLGGLLRPRARLGLSPREMLITTRDGEVFDRFFLKMVSGAVRSEDVRRALEEKLEASKRSLTPALYPTYPPAIVCARRPQSALAHPPSRRASCPRSAS